MDGISLEASMRQSGNFVDVLRNNPTGPYTFPVIPAEFGNWRDETRAWAHGCALIDQTHHMTYLYIRGPQALDLVRMVGVNSFANFVPNMAKQLVCSSPDGYLIGDGILFYLDHELMLYAGREILANWITYNAEVHKFDVTLERDPRSPKHPMGQPVSRSLYRYQISGPLAADVIAKLNGGDLPEIRFFRMASIKIGARTVRCLRHGMAGTFGLEIWGPYEDWPVIRDAVLAAGAEFGIQPIGGRAYPAATFESGWLPSTLPAIYSGEALQAYRQWLPANSYEGACSVGGSFVPGDIDGYYLRPSEAGYGHLIKFDHDFIGRDALEVIDSQELRRKVTFEWNPDDVSRVTDSLLREGPHYKYIDFPMAIYSSHDYDMAMSSGELCGFSMFAGYNYNIRAMLSIGVAGPDVSIGDEVELIWGEPDGGTRKTTVERHVQTTIRARVCEAPYSKFAREDYRNASAMR